ncbi:MAG: hypothetical protein M1822_009625 [Bathelium mastoideum]|nr:MAG: hypothetical protein M1822_009625 [Bathelium mastoideum]
MPGHKLEVAVLSIMFAGANASSISDFSNNLATDLGPLLQLFGEPVTRQYLSEATSFLDYFIFALAPIGILTALVSVIRVCGDSSLRAFVGRAQEGDGDVERELCTSTGRDVCEVFNKNGVTRVLGQPKILEIIQLYEDSGPNYRDMMDDKEGKRRDHDDMGIYLFHDYLQRLPRDGEWKYQRPRQLRWLKRAKLHSEEDASLNISSALSESNKPLFAANPNLSLNVGIEKLHDGLFYAVAALGLVLQVGVIVMAGLVSWQYGWTSVNDNGSTNNTRPNSISVMISHNSSPLTFICGSVLMGVGVFLCAALIGQSTREYTYLRKYTPGQTVPSTRLFWLQPGNQVIGDQTFDAFAYIEAEKYLTHYVSSRKDLSKRYELYTWITIIVTLGGYVAQFIGLRGMSAYISIAQLGASLLMSFLRGCLRIKRLTRHDNKLFGISDKILKHELDWLAFEIGRKDLANIQGLREASNESEWFWYPYEPALNIPNGDDTQSLVPELLWQYRSRLAVLTGHPRRFDQPQSESFHQWEETEIQVRTMSLRLRDAIEGAADAMFGDRLPDNSTSLSFQIPVSLNNIALDINMTGQVTLRLQKNPDPSLSDRVLWTVDSTELEAILGLWLWSLKKGADLEKDDEHGNKVSIAENIPNYRIIGLDKDSHLEEMEMWLGEAFRLLPHSITLTTRTRQFRSITLWQARDGVFVPCDQPNIAGKLNTNRPARRLFGWTALETSKGLSSQLTSQTAAIKVQCVPTGGTLLDQCSHELFAFIVRTLYKSTTADIGEISLSVVDAKLRWQNPKLSSIMSRFEESGLGSSADALICLLPFLRTGLQLPDGDRMIPSLLALSSDYRKQSKWEKAQNILQSACAYYMPSFKLSPIITDQKQTKSFKSFRSAFVALCELYRWAFVRSNGDRRLFGYRGIANLLSQFGFPNESGNEAINEILARYRDIASSMAQHYDEGAAFANYQEWRPYVGELAEALLSWDAKLRYLEDNEWKPFQGAFSLALNKRRPDDLDDIDSICGCDIERFFAEQDQNTDTEVQYQDDGRTDIRPPSQQRTDHELRIVERNDQGDHTGPLAERVPPPASRPSEIVTRVSMEQTAMLSLLCSMTRADLDDSPWPLSMAYATYRGWPEIVAALLELNVDPNYTSALGETALHYAAAQSNYAIAKLLVSQGALPNERDSSGRTPLLMATIAKAEDIISLLLKKRISLSIPDKNGRTPLAVASELGDVEIVERLVQSGSLESVNLRDENGRTAIWYAARKGNAQIVRILLRNAAANPDIPDSSDYTPLAVAGWKGHEEVVRLLAWQNNNPNGTLLYPDCHQRTMLAIAIEKNFESIFDHLLLDVRVNFHIEQISHTEPGGPKTHPSNWRNQASEELQPPVMTAVGLAIQHNREDMFDSLLKDGRTWLGDLEHPLAVAAFHGRLSMIQKLLKIRQLNPNSGDPFAAAAARGHLEVIKTLLRDTRIDTAVGQPLLKAILGGHQALVQVFLDSTRFEPEVQDIEAAVESKFFDIVLLLFQHVKDVNMLFPRYNSGNVLHIAAICSEPVLARALLTKDVDVNLLDSRGQSPLSTALSVGSVEVAEVLISDERLNLANNDITGCTLLQNPDLQNSPRGTILHFAVTLRYELAKPAIHMLLVCPRLDSKAVDKAGRTAVGFLLDSEGPKDRIYDSFQLLLDDETGRAMMAEVATDGRTPLHIVAESGRGIERLLALETSDPNSLNSTGQTPLHVAAIYGNHKSVKALLADPRTNATLRDSTSKNAFELLDINAHGKAAMAFFADGRCNHWRTQSGTTALHVAARYWTGAPADYLTMLLASDRIDANQRDISGQTALWIATDKSRDKIADTLLSDESVDPNVPHFGLQESVLHLLARSARSTPKNRKMLASLFANAKLDPNQFDNDGQTALHRHIDNVSTKVISTQTIKAFVDDRRTNPNTQNSKGQTALHLAAQIRAYTSSWKQRRHMASVIMALLSDKSTDANVKDSNNLTAFHITMSDRNGGRELRWLVESFLALPQLNPNSPDPLGRTVLHLAASLRPEKLYIRRLLGCIKCLLKDERIDPTRVDNEKQTPLHAAIDADFAEAVELFLRDGRIDVNAQDVMGDTALHKAVSLERKGLVELLLKNPQVKRQVRNGSDETARAIATRLESGDMAWLFQNVGSLMAEGMRGEEVFDSESSPSDVVLAEDSSGDTESPSSEVSSVESS